MNLATFPGPGNLWTRDLRDALDDQAEIAREQIAEDLRAALIRGHYINWGTPGQFRLYLAADELQGEVSGIAEADEAFARMIAALANGAPDGEVMTHLRAWYGIAFKRLLDALTEQVVEERRRVTFPERAL